MSKYLASSARRNGNNGLTLSESWWTHFLTEKTRKLSDSPKESWKSVSILNDWIHGHHKIPDTMRFQLSDTNVSSTNEER